MAQEKTRRQHYVQREYLKLFCVNGTDLIYSYNICTGEFKKLKPDNLCVIKDMYECGSVDNLIEMHIKEYEDRGIKQIKAVIDQKSFHSNQFTEEDLKSLYEYVFLQLTRTKSGQLIFQSVKDNLDVSFSNPRTHVSNEEIKNNKHIIDKNLEWIHDYIDEFDFVVDSLWNVFHESIRFGLYISEKPLLITTDNPVCTDVIPSLEFPSLCYFKMALSPNILLNIEVVLQKNIIGYINRFFECELTSDIADEFNKTIISNANYWVMSSTEFTNSQKQLLEEQQNRMTKKGI